jgi:hypothetical protein
MIQTSYSQTENKMEKLSWILDKWVSKDSNSISYETWSKVNSDLFEGHSQTIKNGDTVFSEKLKIQKIGNDIFYIADVKHNPAPVAFKLTSITDNEAVFENPEHDFPKKITYKNEDGNLHAWIEGRVKNNQWQKIDFFMSKTR